MRRKDRHVKIRGQVHTTGSHNWLNRFEKGGLIAPERIRHVLHNKKIGDALGKQHRSIKSGRKCAEWTAFPALEVSGQDQCRSSTRRCRKTRQHVGQSARPGIAFRAFSNERRSMPMNAIEDI
jgi:hypothetical protein